MRLTHKIRIALLAGILLLLAVGLFNFYGMPALLKREMGAVLAQQGLTSVTYNSFSRRRGEIMLSGIRLDPEGFSSIETVRARTDWPALLTGAPLFSELIIDGMNLTGEIDDDGRLTVSGWSPRALLTLAGIRSVVLNSARLDLMTPSGALRFEAKGRLTAKPDGSRQLEAALWSRQHQLVLDTRWDGTFTADGRWTASADIREAKLNLTRITASRITGWLNFEGEGKNTPSVSGQIAAGLMKAGEGLAGLNGFNATIDGRIDSYHAILSGNAADYDGLTLSADIITGAESAINLTIEGEDIHYLLAFADSLNRDIQAFSGRTAGFTTLLLTPGNASRLKTVLADLRYDILRLVIDGTPYDLTGKIIATRYVDGTPQNNVISINPAP